MLTRDWRVVSRGQLRGGTNVVVIATIENPALGSRVP
jgi:hypothetical protein